MVDSPPGHRIDVDEHLELRVRRRLFGGEARFRHLYCVGGAVDDVLATWRELPRRRGRTVLSRDEAIERGWFGTVDAEVRPRLGDVVVAAHDDHAVVSTVDFPYENRLVGLHGSLTRRRDGDPDPGEAGSRSTADPRSAERQRLADHRHGAGAGGGHPAAVVLAAQHLVGDLGAVRWSRSSTSPTTMTSPSVTISPFSVRALWVARLPHQHSASTWSTWMRSASSTSRARPREQLGAEVAEDAEGEHVDLQLVDDPGELVDLRARCRTGPRRRSGSRSGRRGSARRRRSARSRSPSVTSSASCSSPSREDRIASPARSWLVNIRPTRPRAAWLWFVCRARVLFPESIVPVKNWSSAIGDDHGTRDPTRRSYDIGPMPSRLRIVRIRLTSVSKRSFALRRLRVDPVEPGSARGVPEPQQQRPADSDGDRDHEPRRHHQCTPFSTRAIIACSFVGGEAAASPRAAAESGKIL